MSDLGLQVRVAPLGSDPKSYKTWLASTGANTTVVDTPQVSIVRNIVRAWYLTNSLLVNKLRFLPHFALPSFPPIISADDGAYSFVYAFHIWPLVLSGLLNSPTYKIAESECLGNRHELIGERTWISLSMRREAEILNACDRVVAISEYDYRFNSQNNVQKQDCVPYFPHNWQQQLAFDASIRPSQFSVGFFASSNALNRRILRVLLGDRFLSRLSREGVRLVIAGGISHDIHNEDSLTIRRFNVDVLGTVPLAEDFYRQVQLIINPIGPSTGIKIKTVEAHFYRRRVVTTAHGTDDSLLRHFSRYTTLTSDSMEPDLLVDAVMRARASTPSGQSAYEDDRAYAAAAQDFVRLTRSRFKAVLADV